MDAETIAKGLSERHRFAITHCDPTERLMGGFFGLAWAAPETVEASEFHHPIFGSHYRLSSLGLAVREILLRDQ